MRAAPARRRGRCVKVARYPVEALPAVLSALGGGGALGIPGPLSARGGGGDLGMQRPFGSRGGLPCPRGPRGSSRANGVWPFDAKQACEMRRVETRRRRGV